MTHSLKPTVKLVRENSTGPYVVYRATILILEFLGSGATVLE